MDFFKIFSTEPNTGLPFDFLLNGEIDFVSPNVAPVSTTVNMTLSGKHFPVSGFSQIFCLFSNGATTNASIYSESFASCMSPVVTVSHIVSVE